MLIVVIQQIYVSLGVKWPNTLTFLINCAIVFGWVFHRVCKIYVRLTFFTNLYTVFFTHHYYSFRAMKFYAFGILLTYVYRQLIFTKYSEARYIPRLSIRVAKLCQDTDSIIAATIQINRLTRA